MKDANAEAILSRVMSWNADQYSANVPHLQLLASYKYDRYQRFEPGKHFIESLSLWLDQFERSDRELALSLVRENLIFVSDEEMRHLVRMSYPDVIVQERIKAVADEIGFAKYEVVRAANHRRFLQLQLKSLYLGLSDGAHTNELRRASGGGISNEQIWQAYELGEDKAVSMSRALRATLEENSFQAGDATFSVVWLMDDFSGSGNTYIRYDGEERAFKGKITKVYKQIVDNRIVDQGYYEVFLLLYVATRQAIDHIEYWAGRFTSQFGYKPIQIRVVHPIERSASLSGIDGGKFDALIAHPDYFDARVTDEHMLVGGTDGRTGFAGCALPLVLAHNTPNNSVYILWGPDDLKFFGLFPRVSRHRGG